MNLQRPSKIAPVSLSILLSLDKDITGRLNDIEASQQRNSYAKAVGRVRATSLLFL